MKIQENIASFDFEMGCGSQDVRKCLLWHFFLITIFLGFSSVIFNRGPLLNHSYGLIWHFPACIISCDLSPIMIFLKEILDGGGVGAFFIHFTFSSLPFNFSNVNSIFLNILFHSFILPIHLTGWIPFFEGGDVMGGGGGGVSISILVHIPS